MDQDKAQIEARIRAIRSRFSAAIPQFRNDTGARWKILRHSGWDAVVAAELQQFAHKLAGSGATFGYPDISRAARVVDVALGAIASTGEAPPAEKLVTLERQVGDLLNVLGAASEAEAPAAPPPAPVPAAGGIVVISADAALGPRLAPALEHTGHRLSAFASLAEAAASLRASPPGLVLLELQEAGHGTPAFELVQRIRGESGERTPVVIVSGRADFAARLDATRAGADGYLSKPLDSRQLGDLVARLAGQPHGDRWRCLVIDDDTLLAEQIVAWLQAAGMAAEAVNNPRDSLLRIADFGPDVVVMDYNMPEANGVELATMVRQDPQTALLPIVFLTSERGEGVRADAMAAGADDFLLKPVDRQALIQSIVARARLGKRLQEQVGRVTREAPKSSGLSRHFFFTELERLLDEADDGPVQAALVLLGLSEAASVASQHGAPGAAALQQQWRERIAASGVEQWAMLGENIVGLLLPRDSAGRHPARVRELLDQLAANPYEYRGARLGAGLGAGVLHLRQSQSAVPAVLAQAEQLLGLALAAGAGTLKEGFVGTAASGSADASGQLPTEQLRAVYQPIVTIDGVGAPVNAVLARIADKDGNLMPPGKFMSVLEKRGWLPELDAWIFQAAHRVLTTQIAADAPLFLIVHASPQSLTSAVYIETVLAVLAAQPMRQPDQCLVVAVPESAWVTHRATVQQLSQALLDAGGGLMLANFGGSATSVEALEALHPVFVRLDDLLARRLEQAEYADADRALMTAAQDANVSVIASGIENARSLSALWSKGVRRFQGYFIQEPSEALGGPG